MIAMKFTLELDIGLSFSSAGCSATAIDRSRDENSSSRAIQAIARPHCRRRTEISEAERDPVSVDHRVGCDDEVTVVGAQLGMPLP